MCGIMAYTGSKQAFSILIDGLKKLEYRGYDSAGVALYNNEITCLKKGGKVSDLLAYAADKSTDGCIGIGHTRWATHGEPTDQNAHPHCSESGRLAMVHNGIIENYEALKNMLQKNNFTFQSDTDTEVLVQLIEWYQCKYQISTKTAMCRALQDVEGSFAVVLFDRDNPSRLYVARRQSPIAIGVGDGEYYVSSDAMTLAGRTDQFIYLEEDVLAILDQDGGCVFYELDEQEILQQIQQVDLDEEIMEKGLFDSYMLKEIHEQQESVVRAINHHIDFDSQTVQMERISKLTHGVDRIIITACGTSWHSGLVAEYLLEKYAKINVEVEYASEFRYKEMLLTNRDLVIGISQSGETADTMAALELAKRHGVKTMAFVNGINSSIARMVDEVIYLNAGPEIGVASTKAFTSQLSAVLVTTLCMAQDRFTLSLIELKEMIGELAKLPEYIASAMANTRVVEGIAYELMDCPSALFLGRGMMYPIANEGSLKLKEISYIHAEGYPAGEMKHGPIALIDEHMPVISLVNNDDSYAKMISNIQEVKARKAIIIIIKNKSVELPEGLADYVIEVPDCPSYLNPIVQTIPLQLLSYYVAKLRGCNVDQPRNLAKSVTVE